MSFEQIAVPGHSEQMASNGETSDWEEGEREGMMESSEVLIIRNCSVLKRRPIVDSLHPLLKSSATAVCTSSWGNEHLVIHASWRFVTDCSYMVEWDLLMMLCKYTEYHVMYSTAFSHVAGDYQWCAFFASIIHWFDAWSDERLDHSLWITIEGCTGTCWVSCSEAFYREGDFGLPTALSAWI